MLMLPSWNPPLWPCRALGLERTILTGVGPVTPYPAQRQAIVFEEVRDRLVIRCEPTQQPHDLDIASGLTFESPARLHPVQIAVDVKLEENRGVVRWPTSRRRLHPFKAHLSQIERIDKHVDHANRVALVNEIIEAFGQ